DPDAGRAWTGPAPVPSGGPEGVGGVDGRQSADRPGWFRARRRGRAHRLGGPRLRLPVRHSGDRPAGPLVRPAIGFAHRLRLSDPVGVAAGPRSSPILKREGAAMLVAEILKGKGQAVFTLSPDTLLN